nr:RING finger protein 10 isoform X2 [Aegilops tauschii subsp. strangulata]
MSISPTESTRGSHPPAPRASNPSPSPRHGTASRRGSRSSPRASAAAPGVGRDGASPDSVGFIGQSVDTPQAVVGFRISGEEDDPYAQEVIDGQHLILHPLNMKCLLNHFGNSDMLPPRVTGKILELETITQSEASRKRYRFLSHFSLTTTFQFCEIDLSDMLPPASLAPFMDEIKRREKQRIQTAKKEEKDRVKAEVAAAAQESAMRFEYTNFSRTQSDVMFSLDDFEALGNNAAGPSTSPPAGERKLFSDVTRLGFASALDSPPLRAETGDTNNEITRDQGPVAASSVSFASILSSTRASADSSAEMPKPNGVGKAGKKRTKVLLSTGGGRRY